MVVQGADGTWVYTDPEFPGRSVDLRHAHESTAWYAELRIGTARHGVSGINDVWTRYIGEVDLVTALAYAANFIKYDPRSRR
jgi:hypothetical protein